MQLSLITDDYFYMQKRIAIKDAKDMRAEIAQYKYICDNDERCLQVIDKLTRIFTKIIEGESSEMQIAEASNSLSNSNIDSEMMPTKEGANNKVVATSSPKFEKHKISTQNSHNQGVRFEHRIEKSSADKNTNSITCLRNIKSSKNNNKLKKVADTKDSDTKDANSPRIFKADSKTTEKGFLKTQIVSSVKINSKENMAIDKHDTNTKANTGIKRKRTNKKMALASETSKISNKEKPKREKRTTQRKKPVQSCESNQKLEYESDLSWVQSLKYIREVAGDEFDSKLGDFTASFWENCTLPGCVDENDFFID
ncbi:uncharacterized protein LOC126974973 isoform X2 [Leptidea sinapis]|nr:uncharacterized protein LOC126974973 isoform X2 [Leptidea sinapis]